MNLRGKCFIPSHFSVKLRIFFREWFFRNVSAAELFNLVSSAQFLKCPKDSFVKLFCALLLYLLLYGYEKDWNFNEWIFYTRIRRIFLRISLIKDC